jgi:hypothetical protein
VIENNMGILKNKKISIIICSINPERCEKSVHDISKTIGVEHGIIVFDNREYNWGLCKVYNQCAEKTSSPYLCFMHEDLFIETDNWGGIIIDFAEDTPNCGVIGFAGGLQAAKNMSSWWFDEKRMNVNDGYTGKNKNYRKYNYKYHQYVNPKSEAFSQVICIDGVFHFVKKSVWEEIKYDESNFNGFHFYDIDFSFAVAQKYKNYVLFNMNVFHDSPGSTNSDYINNMIVFQNKWNKYLPFYLDNNLAKISKSKIIRSELREMIVIYKLYKENYIKIKGYIEQICKINGKYIVPIFYIYYFIRKIADKIVILLQKI